MQTTRKIVVTDTVEFSEQDIKDLLEAHVVATLGPEWKGVYCSIWRQTLPVAMGDLDDRYEIVAKIERVS